MSGSATRLSAEWTDLLRTLEPNSFKRRLAHNLERAGHRVGRDYVKIARGLIRAAAYAPNSPVTIALKGSSKPLVDKGDLFQGISYELDGPYNLRMGLLKRRVGQQVVNVGLVLHEGATIDVSQHPQVRRKVWAMVRKAVGADRLAKLGGRSRKAVAKAAADLGIKATGRSRRGMFGAMKAQGKLQARPASGSGRQVWVIPSRPFLSTPATSADFNASVAKHYTEAIRATFQGRG